MGAISCRQRTMRSGGRVELALEKRELARWEVEGRVRAQLKVVMYAVRSVMVSEVQWCIVSSEGWEDVAGGMGQRHTNADHATSLAQIGNR